MSQNSTPQLDAWRGEFGRAYTDRNKVDWKTLVPGWQAIVGGLSLRRVLEVGCNRGHNLIAIAEVLGPDVELWGVEPNDYARGIAKSSSPRLNVVSGSIFDLPFKDRFFDLTITSGVLIHVALDNLDRAMAEMVRTSSHYVCGCEYFAEQETVVHYRGSDDLLWKRDFARHYRAAYPELIVERNGYLEDWDRAHWWLMSKGEDVAASGNP